MGEDKGMPSSPQMPSIPRNVSVQMVLQKLNCSRDSKWQMEVPEAVWADSSPLSVVAGHKPHCPNDYKREAVPKYQILEFNRFCCVTLST